MSDMHVNQVAIDDLCEADEKLRRIVNSLIDIMPTDNDLARTYIEQARRKIDSAIAAIVLPE